MISNSKYTKRQLALSRIMFFVWLAACISCIVAAIIDIRTNGNENIWQFVFFFAVCVLMVIYRYAIIQRNKKQLD
jgi:membrane protein YdbS with pleckstrin-like domain